MNKILFFNGCSFTSGDELVWDQFCKDFTWRELVIDKSAINSGKIKESHAVGLYLNYVKNFRTARNVGALCSNILNTDKIDLSMDGNSNDNIALSTINYLMRLDEETRKRVHVCIGWTASDRRIKYSKRRELFQNLHSYSILEENTELHNYTIATIIENTDVDHSLNYLMNVTALENYLLRNNISYTFWRALANITELKIWQALDESSTPHDLMSKSCLPVFSISNKENWLNFDNEPFPWIGKSWDQTLTDEDKISKINKHPNLQSAENLAVKISEHVKNYL